MNDIRKICRDGDVMRVYSFDGQTVWYDRNTSLFEVGNFLGGGAAGNVYECEHLRSREHFALKILNPLGYKLMSPALLRKCNIVSKGETVSDTGEYEKVEKANIWWLINGSTKQFIAAYFSEKQNCLRELSLVQCIQVWGSETLNIGDDDNDSKEESVEVLQVAGGPRIYVPSIPPKYADFIRRRSRIFREIRNMRKIPTHTNVIRLEGVLELTQESKCTIFLVMELANGGELFDRIKLDCGAREDTAKLFFQQLLQGVMHCHTHGVCHRDLKPENLLLQDTADNGTILKIADFGFSARFAMGDSEGTCLSEKDGWDGKELSSSSFQTSKLPFASKGHGTSTSLPDESLLRVLKSVVGSPFYVAPEVLQARGYDGPKADVWSLGVILYAMLAGNLPFEQELSTCKRFRLFCKWVREQTAKGIRFWNDHTVEYPQWLFPAKFSMLAKGLIVAMLHPDPDKRVSVSEAMRHPLCASHFVTQTAVMSTGIAASEIAFSLLPIAVAAAAGTTNTSAMFHTQCAQSHPQLHYDTADMTVIPIASAVMAAVSSSVPVAVGGTPEPSTIPQGDDKYAMSMEIVDDERYSVDPTAPPENDPNHSPRSLTSDGRDSRRTISELFPCREQDESDDGMFIMEEEIVRPETRPETRNQSQNSQNHSQNHSQIHSQSQSSKESRSISFASINAPSDTTADWKIPRKRSNLVFPSTTAFEEVSRTQIPESDPGSMGASRDSFSGISGGDIFRGITTPGGVAGRSVMDCDNRDTAIGHVPESPSVTLRYLSYSPQQVNMSEPPVAPMMMSSRSIDDLITGEEDDYSPYTPEEIIRNQPADTNVGIRGSKVSVCQGVTTRSVRYAEQAQFDSPTIPTGGGLGSGLSATHPPSFNDSVKRSTRFITAVPASEVLDKVESILEQVRLEHVQTPIGIIGKIAINWAAFRIEVWGAETSGPPLCALQLYQMPTTAVMQSNTSSPNKTFSPMLGSTASPMAMSSPFLVSGGRISPSFSFMSPYERPMTSSSAMDSRRFSPSLVGSDGLCITGQQQLFLAEFVRGQLEIFAFKRFYQWVRQRLSQLVKRDYAFKLLDQGGSPMVDSYLLQRFQQCSS